DDPDWRLAVRRTLVEALLERLATDARLGLDAAARSIGVAYEKRTIFFALAPIGTPDAASSSVTSTDLDIAPTMLARAVDLTAGPASPADMAEQLYQLWYDRAQAFIEGDWAPYPLYEVRRRHNGRQRFARGPIQEFAAAQVSLAEAMAYVVAANRPSQADQIRALMDTLARERRIYDEALQAQHIFSQLHVTEATILRLWLIMLGESSEIET
ncbi:MAG: hypothetical protein KDA21_06310, partial [Phycisphaerales bacterium]|nr:hypothetical protein [Phycisphaerales bacterium]